MDRFLTACCGITRARRAFDAEAKAEAMIAEFGELAPVFAFQKSEDAMNAGGASGNRNWLEGRNLIYDKPGLPPGG